MNARQKGTQNNANLKVKWNSARLIGGIVLLHKITLLKTRLKTELKTGNFVISYALYTVT